jgi:hypothetical protein
MDWSKDAMKMNREVAKLLASFLWQEANGTTVRTFKHPVGIGILLTLAIIFVKGAFAYGNDPTYYMYGAIIFGGFFLVNAIIACVRGFLLLWTMSR